MTILHIVHTGQVEHVGYSMHKSYIFPSSNQRGVPTAYQSKPNGTSGPCREHLQTGSHRFSRKKTAGATFFSVLDILDPFQTWEFAPKCPTQIFRKAIWTQLQGQSSLQQQLRPQVIDSGAEAPAMAGQSKSFSVDHSESSILAKKIYLLASYLYILPLVAKDWSTKVSNQGWPRQIWVVRRFWFALPGFVLVSGSLVGLGSWIFWVKF